MSDISFRCKGCGKHQNFCICSVLEDYNSDFSKAFEGRQSFAPPYNPSPIPNTPFDMPTLNEEAKNLNLPPKSDKVSPGIEQIPFEAIEAIGRIFSEGEIKYGLDNWKKGVRSEEYQRERLRHAIRHLHLYADGDQSEDHLAKVAWFCTTQIWIRENSGNGTTLS